jgi:hypothetical protein
MTVETKTTIQASDVVTLEFECAHCHSITSWPLTVAKNPPTRCHCGHGEWMSYGGAEFAAISDLITLLKQFSKAPNTPYIMRFGLAASVHASDKID